MSRNLQNQLFQLKYTSKTLEKQSKKAEKNAKTQKLKCKKAMEKGNMDVARIHAEGAIREKNSAVNLLKLSARIDAVAQRVGTAVTMNGISNAMSGVVNSMATVMQSMDAVKISATMDKFEKQFEDLDMSTQFMEGAMASQGAITTPANEVEDLMGQVAEEHNLEWEHNVAPQIPNKPVEKEKEPEKLSEEDALAERLRKLQGL